MDNRSGRRAKPIQFALSYWSVFWTLLGFLCLLVWAFVLGILVERGLIPHDLSRLTPLKGAITEEQGALGAADMLPGLEQPDEGGRDPEFDFDRVLNDENAGPVPVPLDVAKTPPAAATPPKAPTPAAAPEIPASRPAAGPYSVQIAALDTQDKARALVTRLQARGYPAFCYEASVKGKTYFRVRCGGFQTASEAEALNLELGRREKIRGLVVRQEK